MPRPDPREILAALGADRGRPARNDPEDRLFDLVATILDKESVEARGRLRVQLTSSGLVDLEAMAGASVDDWSEAVRPASQGASRRLYVLGRFLRWLADRGGLDGVEDVASSTLRDELAGIPGLGPSSVESLLLFGFGRPAYPVDRATFRVFARHGWIDESSPAEEAREFAIEIASGDPRSLQDLSFGLDRIARSHCRASAPLCDGCPLTPWLPERGPIWLGE